MLPQDFIVQRYGTYNAAQPATFCPTKAQQSHQVTTVGMKRQMRIGLVTTHVDVAVAAAMIVDMPQQIAARVLRHRHPEMRANPPENQPDLIISIVGDIE